MRLLKVLLVLIALSTAVFPAMAQDTALEFGQAVAGEISDREFEFEYSFTGEEGQLVSIRMSPAEESQLDPEIYLYSPDNDLLAANDDFPYPSSLILYTLPTSGEYQVVATRNDGRSGSTAGEFTLEISLAEAVSLGTTIEATYSTDFFSGVAPTYLLAPKADGPVTLTYSQDNSDVYAGVRISAVPDWTVDPEFSFYEDVFWLGNTALTNSGSITLNLIGGRLYMLRVEFGGYSPGSTFSAEEGVISITIE